MNFYWIDSFLSYDPEFKESIFESLNGFYKSHAEKLGLRSYIIDTSELAVVTTGANSGIYHESYGDILHQDGLACLGLVNISPEAQIKQEMLYKVIRGCRESKRLKLVNDCARYEFVDRSKTFGMQLAQGLGIQVIPSYTLFGSIESQIDKIEQYLGPYPYVCKPDDYLCGIGIDLIKNRDELLDWQNRDGLLSKTYLVQKKIEFKSELRVYLGGGKVIGCVRKTATGSSWQTNISKGASGQISEVPKIVSDRSEEIARFLGTNYLCIDWLDDGSGYFFNEIESAGGFTAAPQELQDIIAKYFFSAAGDSLF